MQQTYLIVHVCTWHSPMCTTDMASKGDVHYKLLYCQLELLLVRIFEGQLVIVQCNI